MQHVNPSFNIQASEISTESAQLFVEAGPVGISLLVLNGENCFNALVIYSFPSNLDDDELAALMKEVFSREILLQKQFHKTHIFWSFADSILVPAELMNADRNMNMLNLVFGDANQGLIRSDFLYKHNLHNVYRTPQFVIDIFSARLPVATQTHLFSTIVNIDLEENDHLYSVFYNSSITIMLSKAGKLQVIQNFNFTNADDCVFHLLNVCKGFDVAPDLVTLHINGLIDEQSGLYDAIHRYFLNISFDSLPASYTYVDAIKEHPPHFFSHLFILPACV